MKLLWLADRVHLNKYGRLILRDQYSALPHGPVPSGTLNTSQNDLDGYFGVTDKTITAVGIFDPSYFSKSDIEVMESVWQDYGNKGGWALREFSHLFPEWKRYEKQLKDPNLPKSYPIVIDDLFVPPTGANYYYDPLESEKSRSIFLAHQSIQNMLSEE